MTYSMAWALVRVSLVRVLKVVQRRGLWLSSEPTSRICKSPLDIMLKRSPGQDIQLHLVISTDDLHDSSVQQYAEFCSWVFVLPSIPRYGRLTASNTFWSISN